MVLVKVAEVVRYGSKGMSTRLCIIMNIMLSLMRSLRFCRVSQLIRSLTLLVWL